MAANKETSVGIKLVADLRNYQKNLSSAKKESKQFKKNVSQEMGDVKNSISQLARGDISALPGFFKAAATSAGGFSKGLHGIKAALIATGIGALLVGIGLAIGAITQYFKGTEEGQIVFKKVMNNIKAYTEPVLQMFGKFGKALVHLFKGEFGAAWETAKGAIKETGEAIQANKENVDELNTAEEKLIKTRRANLVANKRLEAEVAEARLKANDEENYTAAQRAKYIAEAISKQKQLAANKREELDLETKIAQIKASFGDNDIETNDHLAQLEADRYEILREQDKRLMMISETQQRINKELNAEVAARQKIAAVMADKEANAHLTTIETRKFEGQINPNAVPLDTSSLQDMGSFLDENAEKTQRFREQLLELNDTQQAVVDSVSGGFQLMAGNIIQSLGLANSGFEGFLAQMLQTVTKLIAMLLSQAIGNAIVGATASGAATGPGAIFTTPAFIATAVAGVLAAFAAIPKFADGGLAFGPTLGLMGEYSGARNNPEVIAPLNKLKQMLPGNQGGGVTEITGTTKIMDDHILISYQRAASRQRNRT